VRVKSRLGERCSILNDGRVLYATRSVRTGLVILTPTVEGMSCINVLAYGNDDYLAGFRSRVK
jgi:hypothetical protein